MPPALQLTNEFDGLGFAVPRHEQGQVLSEDVISPLWFWLIKVAITQFIILVEDCPPEHRGPVAPIITETFEPVFPEVCGVQGIIKSKGLFTSPNCVIPCL